jgi:group I intron endonuclease
METNEKIIENPYGFIYITTNMVNGKKYLGQKKFDEYWKNYLGSGTVFKRAIKKYGKENFTRNIIQVCYSKEELDKAEYDLTIFLNVVEDPNWYNLKEGGSNGKYGEEAKRKISENHADVSGENHPMYGKHITEEHNKRLQEGHREKCSGENNPWYGKQHLEETKNKISESISKQVYQYDEEGNLIKVWKSAIEIKRELGYSNSSIAKCCRGELNQAYGYKWSYKPIIQND